MKFDWSKILIVTMVCFILLIVGMGIKMATSSQELYEEDYYELGEEHASRMNMEVQAKYVSYELIRNHNQFLFQFDSIGLISSFKLVHLADKSQDRDLIFTDTSPSSNVKIALGELEEGNWIMEVQGEVNGKPFFKKQQLAL